MKKFALGALLVLVVLPIGAFALYDAMYFMPQRDEIARLLQTADPEDRNPPAVVQQLIDAEQLHSGGSPATTVARDLLTKLSTPSHQKALVWAFNYAMWTQLVHLHLTKEDQYGLYCALAYNGQDSGANALSKRIFAKPLSQLSDIEAATVVAVLSSPSQYAEHTDAVASRRDTLLQRIHSATP